MIYYYINAIDRSGDVEANTFSKQGQIQQRTDVCSFDVFQGTKPEENQDLKIYDGATVLSHAGDTIVLKDTYELEVNAFRTGQFIWLKIGDSAIEKAEVLTYTESTKTIVLTASPDVSLSADDQIGELIFGGTIAQVQDENVVILENIIYKITGTDYTRIFDKKRVSDTWEDEGSRYIINDFLNTTVNYNSTIDNLSYANATAIRAEWIESGDGDNPNVDTANYLESTSAGVFAWTNAGGTALWSATPTSKNLSQFFGVSSGQPIEGFLMLWGQTTDQAKITTLKIRLGSDSSNYALFTFELTDSEDFQYMKSRGVDAVVTGTPDWTAADYCAIEIVETSDGTINLNGIRVNDDSSFTCFNVESTNNFDDYRSPHLSPAKLINQIAKSWERIWYIDYERDIHFKIKENTVAPYSINDTSDNFTNLKMTVDTSSLGNRIKIFGGEKISDSEYTEIKEGDSARREFNLTSKFSGLVITLDDNTSTDLMEAGTTTTNITAGTHGLVTGDYITNRTRANAVRKVTKVDNDNFTVEAVTAQTNGDTFSKFATAKTSGIEGLVDETTVDYVYNSNAQSVRATDSEDTYDSGDFLKFTYYERLPINIEYTDSASANALKALRLGDGIFELDPISDRNIQDDATALSIAQAKVQEFGNPIITGTFKTDQKGLDTGQLLTIVETTNRSISAEYVIQTIRTKQKEGKFKDYLTFNVQFGTTLFGWIEFMQKLLANGEDVELNTDSVVQTFAVSYEDVECADVNIATLGGILVAEEDEDIECSDVNATYKNANNWKFEPSTGQPVKSRFNLASFG